MPVMASTGAAGTGGGQADPDLAGRLGVAGGHERGRLLVVDEHEPDLVLVAAQALHDPVDAVPGQPEHGVHAPVGQPLDEQLGRDLVHANLQPESVGWPPGGHARLRPTVGRSGGSGVATKKQVKAAKRNVQKAQAGAQKKRSIANMPAKTRSALGKQGAAVAQRKRTGGSSPKTRQELYDIAKRKNLPGRSKMGRDELAKALGYK
jgi:hypothetical protein